jgi:ketosteroid isomerase-like protein
MSSTAIETASRNLAIATDYVRAIESGATGEALARFLHPEVTHYDLPNRFDPAGKITERNGMLAAAERGQRVMRQQKYDILSSVTQGEVVVLEMDWIGRVAMAVAGIPAGGEMHARIATFLEFQDGLIILQRDYVCYDPF